MAEGIPKLQKRGKVFYVSWTEAGRSRRRSLDTMDPKEVRLRYAAFLAADTDAPAALTCGDILNRYHVEHTEQKTVDTRRQSIVHDHLFAYFANIRPRDVAPQDIDEYCRQRAAGQIGNVSQAPTHRRELAILKAALAHAMRKRRLAPREVPLFDLPKSAPPKDRWLNTSELRDLFYYAGDYLMLPGDGGMSRMYRFVVLAYYTGSRRNAIERLTWGQVDLENARINLAQEGEQKTKKRRPVVPITPALMPILRLMHKQKSSEFVLDHPGDMLKGFRRCAAMAGMDDVTPHTLRHTRAVHLAQKGVPLLEIAGLLGDTIGTVAATYLHYSPDHLSGIMAADSPVGAQL